MFFNLCVHADAALVPLEDDRLWVICEPDFFFDLKKSSFS